VTEALERAGHLLAQLAENPYGWLLLGYFLLAAVVLAGGVIDD